MLLIANFMYDGLGSTGKRLLGEFSSPEEADNLIRRKFETDDLEPAGYAKGTTFEYIPDGAYCYIDGKLFVAWSAFHPEYPTPEDMLEKLEAW